MATACCEKTLVVSLALLNGAVRPILSAMMLVGVSAVTHQYMKSSVAFRASSEAWELTHQ